MALIAIDFAAVLTADVAGYSLRFGTFDTQRVEQTNNWGLALTLPFAWVLVAALGRGYEANTLGAGPTEYERVLRTFFHVTALTTFVLCATRVSASRGFILIALPGALLLTAIGRASARKVLAALRRRHRATVAVLALGDRAAIAEFAALVGRDPSSWVRVVAACDPGSAGSRPGSAAVAGMPTFTDLDSIADAVSACGADAVAVLSTSIGSEQLRWISWQLEQTSADLYVVPGLTEVAGRRLHIQPLAVLPLLHVAQPTFQGAGRLAKAGFDRAVALLALLLLSPILVAVAALVRFTSAGPAFFTQVRIGRDGKPFRIVKFRTMVRDAEQRMVELVSKNDRSDGILFKMRDDPRVTRVGRVLRRYSIDELPQLLNVLLGSMSLVGPRPPLQHEVDRYGDDHMRRLLVKPGLTGLWQVSGRSDLSWEQSVRLDLRYVENWSLAGDLMILWKTLFAVVKSSGAY